VAETDPATGPAPGTDANERIADPTDASSGPDDRDDGAGSSASGPAPA
jgi:hypothetical protein